MDTTEPTLAADGLVGRQVGNFQVMARLGAGAMGEVYLGVHPRIERRVAIKVLQGSLTADAEVARRFEAEARLVNRIRHPNLIEIYDFGTLADGRLYYTMECLSGCDLAAYLEERAPLPLPEVDDLVGQIAAGLDAAHDAGVVHRDLKPANLFLVGPPGRRTVKLLDFGISKLIEPGLPTMTQSGIILGTPRFMSPEQAAGDTAAISPASDVYALGVILYQMLSADFPFDADSAIALLAQVISAPPRPLRAVAPSAPAALESLVARCLAKAPVDRPRRAGDVATALHALVTQVGEQATLLHAPEPPRPAVESASTVKAGEPAPTGAGTKQVIEAGVKGRRGGLLALLAAAVLGAAVVLFLVFRTPPASDPRAPDPRPAAAATPDAAAPRARDEVRLTVRSDPPGAVVEVRQGQATPWIKRPPFEIPVKPGDRVGLKASLPGHADEEQVVVVVADREVILKLERQTGAMTAPRPRPRPMEDPRPVEPMPPDGMRDYGETTISPFGR